MSDGKAFPPVPLTWGEFIKSIEDLTNFVSVVANRVAPETLSMCLEYVFLGLESCRTNQAARGTLQRVPVEMENIRCLLLTRPLLYRRALTCTLDFFRRYAHVTEHQSRLDRAIDIIVLFVYSCDEMPLLGTYFTPFLAFNLTPEIKLWRDDTSVCCSSTSRMHLVRAIDLSNKIALRGESSVFILSAGMDIVRPSNENTEELWLKLGMVEHFTEIAVDSVRDALTDAKSPDLIQSGSPVLPEDHATTQDLSKPAVPEIKTQEVDSLTEEVDAYVLELKVREDELVAAMMNERVRRKEIQLKTYDSSYSTQKLTLDELFTFLLDSIRKLVAHLDAIDPSQVVYHCLDCFAVCLTHSSCMKLNAENFVKIVDQIISLSLLWEINNLALLPCALFDVVILSIGLYSNRVEEINLVLYEVLPAIVSHCAGMVLDNEGLPDRMLLSLLALITDAIERNMDLRVFTVTIIPNLLGAVDALKLTHNSISSHLTKNTVSTLVPQAEVKMDRIDEVKEHSSSSNSNSSSRDERNEWWGQALELVDYHVSDLFPDGVPCGSLSEKILCELLDFALVAIRALRGLSILKDGLKNIVRFCQKSSMPFHMLYDSLLFAKQLLQRNQNVTFVFVEVLPRTFARLRAMGEANSEILALRVMKFGCLANQKGLHAVHLFAADVLAWITCIEKVTESSEVRSKLLWHVLDVVEASLKQGHQCDSLISDGIPTLFKLENDPALLTEMIERLAKQFVTAQLGPLLLQMKQSVIFLSKNQEEADKVRALFRCLLVKGQRSLVHELNLVCQAPFDTSAYRGVREKLYNFSEDKLSTSEFLAICQVTVCFLEIGNKQNRRSLKHLADILFIQFLAELPQLPSVLPKSEKSRKQDRKAESKCVELCKKNTKLLNRCSLYDAVYATSSLAVSQENETKDEKVNLVFAIMTEAGVCDLLAELFPQDVIADASTMNVISSIGKRLTSVDSKYSSLHQEVAALLQFFLGLAIDEKDMRVKLEQRYAALQSKILQSPHNVEMISRMLACGYSPKLWMLQQWPSRKAADSSQLHLPINGKYTSQLNLDYKAALRKLLQGWIVLLRELGVTVIQIDNELQVCAALFDELLDLDELRAQRQVVVRVIDQLMSTSRSEKQAPGLAVQAVADEPIFTPPLLRRLSSINLETRRQRKHELLAEEDRLEDEYITKQRLLGNSDCHKLEVVINSSFFGITETCGSEIEGCYAPNGSHCEKPLEMGLRADALVLSLRDVSTGAELENCEALMTEQGLYLYKAYHSAHNYDTSYAWEQAIGWLMAQRLVPAVILPQNFPTPRTFARIRARIGTSLSSITIACKRDLYTDVASYYDLKPDNIRPLIDVYLTSFNQNLLPAAGPATSGTRLKITKGLAGTILDIVLADMKINLGHLLFLSRSLSQFITVFIQTGRPEYAILDVAFDLQRYNLSIQSRGQSSITELERQALLSRVHQLVLSHTLEYLKSYSSKERLTALLKDRNQIFELRDFSDHRAKIEGLLKAERELYQDVIVNTKRCLIENVSVMPISSFSEELQHTAMRWIFKNEDRVWRHRGGRPGQETAEAYVGFSQPSKRSECVERTPIPGMIGFVRSAEDGREVALQAAIHDGEVVCYAVGEFISQEQYEIVTVWVNRRFKGSSLATTMYFQIFDLLNECNCPRVVVDVVQGTTEKMLSSSPALDFVARAGLGHRVIISQQPSYQIVTDTSTQQFERLILAVSYLALASSWHNRTNQFNRQTKSVSRLFSKLKRVF